MKRQKNTTVFISQYRLVEKKLFLTYFNIEIYQKKASFVDVFTGQKELYKNKFLQIKVEEDLKFPLSQITLNYSQNSIFVDFLEIMKNTLALIKRNSIFISVF